MRNMVRRRENKKINKTNAISKNDEEEIKKKLKELGYDQR